jgi:hypothetical protein
VWVVGLVTLLLVVGAVPARAAFAGRNGLLVVQPASGNGLILVGADGANPRQICAGAIPCDQARDPVWSPDGSEIAFSSPQIENGGGVGPDVIYPDGSCLACPVPAPLGGWGSSFGPGFLPDGRLTVSADSYPPTLGATKTDGVGFQPFKISGLWRQPAWSAAGQLAAVRSVKRKSEVFVIDPRSGSTRQLTRGGAGAPNWSPDGRRLAVVHGGWIDLIASAGGRLRRLTRGGAPAWAPDGRQLAFIGAHDRLFVIAVRGGAPRPVGHIRGVRVDWQPITREPQSHCQAPAGSSVLAASPNATVTRDPAPRSGSQTISSGFSILGCVSSDGRERVLEGTSSLPYPEREVGLVAAAGDYAALVNEGANQYGYIVNTVVLFDLRTGTAVANGGGESADCPQDMLLGVCSSGIDQLVVGADGVTAAHTFVLNNPGPYPACASVEQIVANDSTGPRVLDSITTTNPCTSPPPALQMSQLSLSGDTLTWRHAGTPESAQLN